MTINEMCAGLAVKHMVGHGRCSSLLGTSIRLEYDYVILHFLAPQPPILQHVTHTHTHTHTHTQRGTHALLYHTHRSGVTGVAGFRG